MQPTDGLENVVVKVALALEISTKSVEGNLLGQLDVNCVDVLLWLARLPVNLGLLVLFFVEVNQDADFILLLQGPNNVSVTFDGRRRKSERTMPACCRRRAKTRI